MTPCLNSLGTLSPCTQLVAASHQMRITAGKRDGGGSRDLTNPALSPKLEEAVIKTHELPGCVNAQLPLLQEGDEKREMFCYEDEEARGQSLQVLEELPRRRGIGFFLFFSTWPQRAEILG